LQTHTAAERSEAVMAAYKKAFTGFSNAEMAILDGDTARARSQASLMVAPASGPFLFDTSAESWLARSHDATVRGWFRDYLSIHRVHVSAVTVVLADLSAINGTSRD